MSPSDGDEAESTRPISVAELLARNGTIGAPPAGGRRRRRRGSTAAVTVAELTGEIPVIRDEPPAADAESVESVESVESDESDESVAVVEEVSSAMVVVYRTADRDVSDETVVVSGAPETGAPETGAAQAEAQAAGAAAVAPPRSSDPLPRRGGGPEPSHDPRPVRRSSGAEQMAYDPVDESVDLAGLVGEAAKDTAALRSYLKASGGTLFSGETVADDLARRGITTGADEGGEVIAPVAAPRPGTAAALRSAAVAALQSVVAVIFGAGLFIGFDQLWRWNTIVALVLSVLVILGLVIAVRVVRKTEDIASTLIAVAVGALVTLGPLALLQSYG